MPLFTEKNSSRDRSSIASIVQKSRTKSTASTKDATRESISSVANQNIEPVSESDSDEDLVKDSEVLPASDVTIYNEFVMGPAFGSKFPVPFIRYMVERILINKLKNKTYQPADALKWVRELADDVNLNMKGYCKKPRYKHVVKVIIYQQSGGGFFCGARAVWDELSDDYSCITFDSATFVAIVIVFGCYQY